jgi:hypothetical protein
MGEKGADMSELTFKMTAKKGNCVDFGDFTNFADRVHQLLRFTNRAIESTDRSPHFVIQSLEIGSAFCSLGNADAQSGYCMDAFIATAVALRNKTRPPIKLTATDIRTFKKLAEPLENLTDTIVLNGSIAIDQQFVEGCEFVIATSPKSFGQAIGRLDGMNIHTAKFFRIYPEGVNQGAPCYYDDDMHEKVVSLIGQKILVEGLIYRDPDGIGIDQIRQISRLDRVKEDDELPKLSDLFGLFKGCPVDVAAGWEK